VQLWRVYPPLQLLFRYFVVLPEFDDFALQFPADSRLRVGGKVKATEFFDDFRHVAARNLQRLGNLLDIAVVSVALAILAEPNFFAIFVAHFFSPGWVGGKPDFHFQFSISNRLLPATARGHATR
jgi:hypothetical protein